MKGIVRVTLRTDTHTGIIAVGFSKSLKMGEFNNFIHKQKETVLLSYTITTYVGMTTFNTTNMLHTGINKEKNHTGLLLMTTLTYDK